MFTGLVQSIGQIRNIKHLSDGLNLWIEYDTLSQLSIGDSIAIDGACHTIVEIERNSFMVFSSKETIKRTIIKTYKIKDYVNLELPLTLNTRLDGHIVQGHIDTVAKIKALKKYKDSYDFTFSVDRQYNKYLIEKGSIAVNGISLTISNIKGNDFMCAIIPHTYKHTNLQYKHIGNYVNIEFDIVAKMFFSYFDKFKT